MTKLFKKQTYPEALKPFVFHGLITAQEASTASGEQYMGRCPVCLDDEHCGIALAEIVKPEGTTVPGMWRCLKCEETGNKHSFLRHIWNYSFGLTTDLDYEELSADRNIPPDILCEYGLAKSQFKDGMWLMPIFNEEKGMANLYRYDPVAKQEGRLAFLSTPTFRAPLYNTHSLFAPPPGSELTGLELEKARTDYPLFVLEGHWDLMYFDWLMRQKEIRHGMDMVAVPGSGTFNPNWLRYLDRRDVILLYDHDPPKPIQGTDKVRQAGWDGMQKLAGICAKSMEYKPVRVRAVDWKEVV